jgi:transcriptional regulator with XRE-family HTH domain
MRTKTSIIKSRLTYTGITTAARRFGCSREHLSRVLHGSRKPSPELRRGLARLGVTCTVDGKAFADSISGTALLAALKRQGKGGK